MDFGDEDFSESIEDEEIVAENVTSLKEELRLEDQKRRQVDSMKVGLYFMSENCWGFLFAYIPDFLLRLLSVWETTGNKGLIQKLLKMLPDLH